jgi:hypothetical protein
LALKSIVRQPLDSTYSSKGNTLPLSNHHNIRLILCHGLRPRLALISSPCLRTPCSIPRLEVRTSGEVCAAFRQTIGVGLRDDKNFAAKAFHLRCSLASTWLHHNLLPAGMKGSVLRGLLTFPQLGLNDGNIGNMFQVLLSIIC